MIDLINSWRSTTSMADVSVVLIAKTVLLGAAICFFAASFVLIAAFVVSAPRRRQEKARCFLHLLEVGMAQGKSCEETITTLSKQGTQALGLDLHLLAGYIERGIRWTQALNQVPSLLPRRISATLQTGDQLGQLQRVLPLCRESLNTGGVRANSAKNTLMAALCLSPIGAVIVWMFQLSIYPKLQAVAEDMLPSLPSNWPWTVSLWLANILALFWLAMVAVFFLTLFGPRFLRSFGSGCSAFWDSMALLLPWHAARVRRDFSAMLALLLDLRIPESRAVTLAAASTGNQFFVKLAEQASADLQSGLSLTETLLRLDRNREFEWRLRNATANQNGFRAALAGWHETLSARAAYSEEIWSQVITTGFVCLNGVMVGLLAFGFFRILVRVVDGVDA